MQRLAKGRVRHGLSGHVVVSNVRPAVLWVCAAVLGTLAGLNYARLGCKPGAPNTLATEIGFADGDDFQVVTRLVDTRELKTLSDAEFKVLERYADGSGRATVFVAAALSNVHDEALAKRLIPLAMRVRSALKPHPIASEIPKAWKRNGCAVAAARLLNESPARVQ